MFFTNVFNFCKDWWGDTPFTSINHNENICVVLNVLVFDDLVYSQKY